MKRTQLLKSTNPKLNQSRTKPARRRNSAKLESKVEVVEPSNNPHHYSRPINYLRPAIIALTGTLFLFFPKPEVIKYEKNGLVSESVYWPGFNRSQQQLMDSNMDVIMSKNKRYLTICVPDVIQVRCQNYKVVERNGIFSVLNFVLLG